MVAYQLQQAQQIIEDYEDKLNRVLRVASKSGRAVNLSEKEVVEILTLRDKVQGILKEFDQITPFYRLKIHQSDRKLRKGAKYFAKFTDKPEWRNSYCLDEKAWWWFLEHPISLRWWRRRSLVIFTLVLFIVTLAFTGDTLSQVITGRSDLLGALLLSIQGMATLLASTSLLLPKERRTEFTGILKGFLIPALCLLVLFFLLRCAFPFISDRLTSEGIQAYQQGRWNTAEASYKRALNLNHDNAQAHLHLGVLYEDSQQLELARSHYQLAAQRDEFTAINNLARRYIRESKYTEAAILLRRALESEEKYDPQVKYTMLKNLGWARLKQGNYASAGSYLQQAIELQAQSKLTGNRAAPHCLLAQVYDAVKDPLSMAEWDKCVTYADPLNPDEDEWAILGQKKLQENPNKQEKKVNAKKTN